MSDRFNDFAAAALSGLLADGAVRRSVEEKGGYEREDEIAFLCALAWDIALEMEGASRLRPRKKEERLRRHPGDEIKMLKQGEWMRVPAGKWVRTHRFGKY